MAITDNWGYVKRTIAGSLGLLMAQSTTSAESKFLSLDDLSPITLPQLPSSFRQRRIYYGSCFVWG